jgi:hypothetical protein
MSQPFYHEIESLLTRNYGLAKRSKAIFVKGWNGRFEENVKMFIKT